MKIASSQIAMQGYSETNKKHTVEESFNFWQDKQPPQQQNQVIVEISAEGLEKQAAENKSILRTEDKDEITYELSGREKQKILILQKMLQRLTGKKVRFHFLEKIKVDKNKCECSDESNAEQAENQDTSVGWGLSYDYRETYQESQVMSFNSSGKVTTADGREIDFAIDLNMSRQFMSETSLSIRAGDALKDPLVINFDSGYADLTDEKISFDIDSDGEEDQLSFVTSGSGFLALDSNNNGEIDNGTELFGPETGNGFQELSNYDLDGNNWIDENDDIFDKLRIWTTDEDGNRKLFALGQKGVGAIYLGNVDTAFDVVDNENNAKGVIQKTGVFLKENGGAGTVQHVDLAI